MTYTLHYHDDTKPQLISEEDALLVSAATTDGDAMREKRWRDLQRGMEVFVRAGRLVREES